MSITWGKVRPQGLQFGVAASTGKKPGDIVYQYFARPAPKFGSPAWWLEWIKL